MAKKTEKAAVETKEEPTIIHIDLATSEEDVVAYDQAGAELVFLKKRFRALSRDALEALSQKNKDSYRKTVREIREEREASKPAPRPQIIDPLGGHEGALLNVKITDKAWARKWHLCWKHAVEKDALMRLGYRVVRAGEDPVECGLKPAGTTFTLVDSKSRADLDLILMKIEMTTFLQHQTAVAEASRSKVKGIKEKFQSDVEEGSKGRLKGTWDEEEPEKVALKRSDLRPA